MLKKLDSGVARTGDTQGRPQMVSPPERSVFRGVEVVERREEKKQGKNDQDFCEINVPSYSLCLRSVHNIFEILNNPAFINEEYGV